MSSGLEPDAESDTADLKVSLSLWLLAVPLLIRAAGALSPISIATVTATGMPPSPRTGGRERGARRGTAAKRHNTANHPGSGHNRQRRDRRTGDAKARAEAGGAVHPGGGVGLSWSRSGGLAVVNGASGRDVTAQLGCTGSWQVATGGT